MTITKKVFIISSSLLVVGLIFSTLYFFVFREKKPLEKIVPKPPIEETTKKEESIEAKKNDRFFAVTEKVVLGPVVSEGGDHIKYYSLPNGHVFEVLERGFGKKTLSSVNLTGLENVSWSPDRNKVIVYKKNESQLVEKYAYDYKTRLNKKLPDGMENIVWLNLKDKIAYQFVHGEGRSFLSIANWDGSDWKNLVEIPWRQARLAAVPSSSQIAFWNKPNSFETTSLRIISLSGGNPKTIFENKYGADYLWSPDGEKILVSISEEKGGSRLRLGKINSNGGQYQNFNIPTMVSKCVWSSDNKTVYLALPGPVPEGSVMPNDYLNGTVKTLDTFWKLNTETAKQERLLELAEINQSIDATNLFLSSSESILYFVNRYDGRLYGISLP